VTLAVAAAAALVGTPGVAHADPAPTPPAADWAGNLPDPSTVLDGGVYYAYGTQDEGGQDSNIQRISSPLLHTWPIPDLTPGGEEDREALPGLLHPGSSGQPTPTWAVPGATWAPEVVHLGRQWVMYYTVHHPCDTSHPCSGGATDTQCISIATASTPGGTFRDNSTRPFICQYGAGGSIDPAAYVTPGGAVYLYWKSTQTILFTRYAAIYGQRLTGDGLGLQGSPVTLLRSSAAWESGSIEGPAMVPNNNGKYDLFYSGNRYDSRNYAIGYAECTSPLSGCTKKTTSAPWFSTPTPTTPGATDTTPYYPDGPNGPGGESFLTGGDGRVIRGPGGSVTMAYAAWGPVIGPAPRNLWITPVAFDATGQPVRPDKCWPALSCSN
jgi:GH43 family beta-xylosidase